MHFLDQANIFIRSGAGEPGAVSFRREKFIESGGPDAAKGVTCDEPMQASWGRATSVPLPGGGKIGMYQSSHARP